MNRRNIFRVLWSGRFSVFAALVALGLLFTAAGAKAGGCGIPSKTGAAPSIRFLSPHGDDHQEGKESNEPAAIVGLWHLIYTATPLPPSGPFPPTALPVPRIL